MTDTKERNKLEDLEESLRLFHAQLEERNRKLTNIREHFTQLRDKANILRARLQEELNRRGHEHSLKVNVREVTYDEVKDELDVAMDNTAFHGAPERFEKHFVLEVIHTKIQLVNPKNSVIYKEHFPVLGVGDNHISAFLEEIKQQQGVIPYLESILQRDLESILENMNIEAKKAVQANLEELKKNS